ncbi:hypothetical protein EJB05_36815, partial [Eragrostis curvula]
MLLTTAPHAATPSDAQPGIQVRFEFEISAAYKRGHLKARGWQHIAGCRHRAKGWLHPSFPPRRRSSPAPATTACSCRRRRARSRRRLPQAASSWCDGRRLLLDGSSLTSSAPCTTYDGTDRASIGRVVLSFAEKTEHSTVGIVEARALIRGLRLARGLGLSMVMAEGDDLVLVQLLRGEEMQTRIPVAMQQEIVALLRCFPGHDVRHVYREGNQVAHTLCRQAYAYPGVWAGALVPSVVWAMAEDDRRGVAHERAVLRARRGQEGETERSEKDDRCNNVCSKQRGKRATAMETGRRLATGT